MNDIIFELLYHSDSKKSELCNRNFIAFHALTPHYFNNQVPIGYVIFRLFKMVKTLGS